jgi:quercetin dioxygenase-like cupin family protein
VDVSRHEVALDPGEGRNLDAVADAVRVLAGGPDTTGYEVFEITSPGQSGPPPHHHPWDEAYFVLDGSVEVSVGERRFTASAGSFFLIPSGAVHHHRVVSDKLRYLLFTNLPGAHAFFSALHASPGAQAGDVLEILRIANAHQVTAVLPPAP